MRNTTLILAVALVLFCGVSAGHAQNSKEAAKAKVAAEAEAKATANAKNAAEAEAKEGEAEARKATTPYRLDFAVYEIEEGKKVNTRQYSMNLIDADANEIKIGTRVPVETKTAVGNMPQLEYLDVGTKIWCRLSEHSNGLQLWVRSDISNFAPGSQPGGQPIIRQMQINASTVIQAGKPLVIGSVDDPNSKRQYQLEVTVTKLK
jgi:hypothetical protein